MWTKQTTTHKGYSITTRCLIVADSLFQASFTVFPPIGSSWQKFADSAFLTPEAAMAHALLAAQTLIDSDFPGRYR